MARLLACGVLLALSAPLAAEAQSLPQLLRAARGHAVSARVSSAQVAVADAAEHVERAGLLPTLTVKGGYTFNQVESGFTQQTGPTGPSREIVITPQNQVDGSVRASATVLDLGRWRRIDVLALRTQSERTAAASVRLSTDESVVRAYHDGLVGYYVTRSATTQMATAADLLTLAETRLSAGVAAELDVARARAEVERSKGTVAEGQLQMARARRTLKTLTGLDVSFDENSAPFGQSEGFDTEGGLERLHALPTVVKAREDEAIARQQQDDALIALVPRIDVFAEERFTNGAGFGESTSFVAGVQATFTLDARPFRDADQSAASAELAARRAEQSLVAARDTLLDVQDQLATLAVQLRAAEASREAAEVAAGVAKRSFHDGGGTQLDALMAQRDLFEAEVSLAQTRCSQGLAQALLRLAAGDDLAEAVP